jgi:F-type H+-transporting ATPase subunit a
MLLSVVLLLALFIPAASSYKKTNGVPKGVTGFLEPIVLYVRDEIAIPNIGEKKYMRYMPFLLTVFFFIWINNLIGLIPFFPFSANLSGNIAFTLTLALFTAIITNVSANKYYWKHIFLPPVPVWMYPIMIPVELIGVLSKPFALMIRLFANITAGHIIILSLVSLIFIFKSLLIAPVSVGFILFINTIELLVAVLQAFIFTLLSALFIGMAIEDHDHH